MDIVRGSLQAELLVDSTISVFVIGNDYLFKSLTGRNLIRPLKTTEKAWVFPVVWIYFVCAGVKNTHVQNKRNVMQNNLYGHNNLEE